MELKQFFPNPFDEIRGPDDLTPDGVRAWLQALCKLIGESPTQLAREAGIAPSTVNRFLAGGDMVKNLGARTIVKLTEAAGTIHVKKFGTATAPEGKETDPDTFWIATVRVAATLRINQFRKSPQYRVEHQFHVQIPVFSAWRPGILAFMVGDEHGGAAFPRRSIVIGADLGGLPPTSGDHLLVSRANAEGETEITIRQYLVSPNNDAWLTSLAPTALRAPDVYLGKIDLNLMPDWIDRSEYKISQLIVSSIRPESSDKRNVDLE